MRCYLAARFARRGELRGYALELIRRGYPVVSDWLYHPRDDDADLAHDEAAMAAEADLAHVAAADALIAFTEPSGDDAPAGASRGGRHVELGYALARGKLVFVVGPAENVFCHLYGVVVCRDFDECLARLDVLHGIGWGAFFRTRWRRRARAFRDRLRLFYKKS